MMIIWILLILIALSLNFIVWAGYGFPLLLHFTNHIIEFCHSISTQCVQYLDIFKFIAVWIGISLFVGGILYGIFRGAQGLIKARRALLQLPLKYRSKNVVLIEDKRIMAFTHGLLRPKIYISKGLLSLNGSEIKTVFFHELHHKKNMDPLFFFFLNFINSAFFYIPILKNYICIVFSKREQSADDAAVRYSKDPLSLASALLKAAVYNRSVLSFLAPFVGKNHLNLADRIKRLTEGNLSEYKYPPLKKNMPSVLISAFLIVTLLWPIFAKFPGAEDCSAESCPMHHVHSGDYCQTHCDLSGHKH